MATATQQKRLKTLFEQSMQEGGLRKFRENWEKSIGIHQRERSCLTPDGERQNRFEQAFDANDRAVDHRDWSVGEALCAVIGPSWRSSLDQFWQRAAAARFEGVGSDIMAGDTPYVSAGLDVVAGLLNARSLQRAKDPEWIWDRMCTVEEAVGEGGFHIGSRVRPDDQTFQDLADGQMPPTQKVTSTRVHRNRTLNQGLRAKVNYWALRDDLTSQIMESVDQVSVFVLSERERKVADALMGVATGTTLGSGPSVGVPGNAVPMTQDGLNFFPWQTGTLGTNANATNPAPENGVAVANFANDGTATGSSGGDGKGLTDYTTIVRALQTLYANNDPFTGLPPNMSFQGMQFLVAPAAKVQLEFLLQAKAIWQIANYGFNPGIGAAGTVGGATVSDYNIVEKMKLEIVESQYWFNRLVTAGVYKVGSTGTAYQTKLTNGPTDSYNTAGSIMSAYFMGHFKECLSYWQRMPYQTIQVPLSSVEYGEQTVLLVEHRERGFPFWKEPRKVWRTWA